MEPLYYLYSSRNTGWLTRSSTYSTDITEARPMARSEALTLARKHRTDGGYQLLPVRADDMEAI